MNDGENNEFHAPGISLYNGDCLEIMDKLINLNIKVDAIITDPPYGISKKNNFHTLLDSNGRTTHRQGIDFGEWDKNFDLFSWLDVAVKLLSNNGSMFIFNDWKNLGNIARHTEKIGMDIKDCFRWEKPSPMPRNIERRYISDCEFGVWLVKKKSKWVFNRQSDKYERPKFVCCTVRGNKRTKHPTQKPIELMEHLIKIHTNKGLIVFDPFMGSGTTGVAAKNTGRNFIGIELDKKYFDIAKTRITIEA